MSELTEDQKLVKLGLRSPNQTISVGAEVIEKFKNTIDQKFDTFQFDFEQANLSSFADFETWLENNGFGAEPATNIRNTFEGKYPTFDDFNTTVIEELDTWDDFNNEFSSGSGLRSSRTTQDGLSASGIKVYEEAGIGRSGQNIPAGGVEVYGSEVHFSQSTTIEDTPDESAGSKPPIEYSNLSVSPTGVRVSNTVTAEADITNNTTATTTVVAELIVDGSVNSNKSVDVGANSTQTVTFEYTGGEDGPGTFDISIGDLPPVEIQVIYGGL